MFAKVIKHENNKNIERKRMRTRFICYICSKCFICIRTCCGLTFNFPSRAPSIKSRNPWGYSLLRPTRETRPLPILGFKGKHSIRANMALHTLPHVNIWKVMYSQLVIYDIGYIMIYGYGIYDIGYKRICKYISCNYEKRKI